MPSLDCCVCSCFGAALSTLVAHRLLRRSRDSSQARYQARYRIVGEVDESDEYDVVDVEDGHAQTDLPSDGPVLTPDPTRAAWIAEVCQLALVRVISLALVRFCMPTQMDKELAEFEDMIGSADEPNTPSAVLATPGSAPQTPGLVAWQHNLEDELSHHLNSSSSRTSEN